MPSNVFINISEKNALAKWTKKIREGDRVIIIVPTSQVLLTTVSLPKVKISQLRRSIPYVIEDYIACDLSQVHVAFSGFHKDQILVGVVQHSQMRNWLQALEKADIYADVILPEVCLLPVKKQHWTIWIGEEYSLVKTGLYEGFSADTSQLLFLLKSRLREKEKEEEKLPIGLDCFFANSNLFDTYSQKFSELKNITVQSEVYKNSFLSFIKEGFSEQSLSQLDFNLLQSPYLIKKKWSLLKKHWFPVFILLGICLFLFLFKNLTEFSYLKWKNIQLDRKNNVLYQKIFPGKTIKGQTHRQLEKRLNLMQKIAQGHPFFQNLSKVALVLKKSSAELLALDYQEGRLLLRLEFKEKTKVDQLSRAFKEKGLKAKLKEHSEKKDMMTAVWEIK
jgi:general secretion pathway protein L